jgi:hypothetical protein
MAAPHLNQLMAIIAAIKQDKAAALHFTPEIEELLASNDPQIWMRAVLAFASEVSKDAMVRKADRKAAGQVVELLKPYLDAQAN